MHGTKGRVWKSTEILIGVSLDKALYRIPTSFKGKRVVGSSCLSVDKKHETEQPS